MGPIRPSCSTPIHLRKQLLFEIRVTPLDFIVHEFLSSDDRRIGKALVELGDFDLLLVFLHFLDGIGIHGKFFEFALNFPFQSLEI